MRIVIQRVRRASVEVDGREVASIRAGLLALHPRMAAGVFQARMVVNLENDGPVTFVLDSNHSRPPREAA